MPTPTNAKVSCAKKQPRANGVVIRPAVNHFDGPLTEAECLLPVYRRLLASRPAETETQQEAA